MLHLKHGPRNPDRSRWRLIPPWRRRATASASRRSFPPLLLSSSSSSSSNAVGCVAQGACRAWEGYAPKVPARAAPRSPRAAHRPPRPHHLLTLPPHHPLPATILLLLLLPPPHLPPPRLLRLPRLCQCPPFSIQTLWPMWETWPRRVAANDWNY